MNAVELHVHQQLYILISINNVYRAVIAINNKPYSKMLTAQHTSAGEMTILTSRPTDRYTGIPEVMLPQHAPRTSQRCTLRSQPVMSYQHVAKPTGMQPTGILTKISTKMLTKIQHMPQIKSATIY